MIGSWIGTSNIYSITVTGVTKSDSFPLQISNIHQCWMVLDSVVSTVLGSDRPIGLAVLDSKHIKSSLPVLQESMDGNIAQMEYTWVARRKQLKCT